MTLFLNGMFNQEDPWFGQPMYLWGLVLWWLIVIPVTWFLLKRLKWDPFVKFHGLHFAKKNDSAAVLITDDTGDTELVAEHIAKCIFSYGEDDYVIEIPDMPLHLIKIAGVVGIVLAMIVSVTGNILLGMLLLVSGCVMMFVDKVIPFVYSKLFWYPTKYLKDIDWQKAILYKIGGINFDCKIARLLQNGEWDQYPVVNCGGIPVEWTFDSDHWCERRSRQHKAIVPSARAWNKENPHDQVHTYAKYQRYLNEGKIEAPPEIRKDYLVSWTRIDLGFPFNLKNVDWAGKLRQMAKTKQNKTENEGSKYTWILIGGGIVLFIVVLGVRVLMKVLLR